MHRARFFLLLGCWAVAAPAVDAQTKVGPAKGALVVVGGGRLGPDIVNRFLELAGGPDAPLVIIPTADERDTLPETYMTGNLLTRAGAKNVTMVHTRDRAEADKESFVSPFERRAACGSPVAASGGWWTPTWVPAPNANWRRCSHAAA